MREARPAARFALAYLVGVLALVGAAAETRGAERSPLEDWAVQPGFALSVDSVGFDLPTAIAFVPDPGKILGAATSS